jgi:hypothetical protein
MIAGVVCLSTPFLYVKRRFLGGFDEGIFIRLIFVLSFFALLFVWSRAAGPVLDLLFSFIDYLPLPDSWGSMTGYILEFLSVTGFLPIAILAYPASKYLWRSFSTVLTRQEQLMELPANLSTPLLIIRAGGDEASSVLIVSQAMAWFASKFWLATMFIPRVLETFVKGALEILSRRFETVRRHIAKAFLLLSPTIILAVLAFVIGTVSLLNFNVWVPMMVAIVYGLSIYAFGLIFLLLALVVLALVLALPFGLELAFSHIFLNIGIESAPPGAHMIYQVLDSRHATPNNGWNHSLTYEDPESIRVITNWIGGQGGQSNHS